MSCALTRTFVTIENGPDGVVLDVPDVVPSLLPILASAGWRRHPVVDVELSLPRATWPTLASAGVQHLGESWREQPDSALWRAHSIAMALWRQGTASAGTPSLLQLKAELARRCASPCRLCGIRCLANRGAGEIGACGAGRTTRVFSYEILGGEEPGLGTSAAPRLAGCNARCIHCTRPDGLSAASGAASDEGEVAAWIDAQAPSVDALHWVGGNVDQELPFILRVMERLQAPLPVVWNHNATSSVDVTLALLEGVIDVYLPDLRFGPGGCASALGAPAMDFATCTEAIDGELRQRSATVVVRHLVLPGHVDCCSAPIMRWLHDRREQLLLNLMGFSYGPAWRAVDHPVLGRPVSKAERSRVEEMVSEYQLRRIG